MARRRIVQVLRTFSFLACVVMIVSFTLFVVDQSNTESTTLQNEVNNVAQPTAAPPASKGTWDQVRTAIDDTNRTLASPFESIAPNTTRSWANHIVLLVCGFLLYGVALRLLAREFQLSNF